LQNTVHVNTVRNGIAKLRDLLFVEDDFEHDSSIEFLILSCDLQFDLQYNSLWLTLIAIDAIDHEPRCRRTNLISRADIPSSRVDS